MKYLLPLLLLTSCISAPDLPKAPDKGIFGGFFKPKDKKKDTEKEAPKERTPSETMNKAYSLFIYIWGLSVLAGIILVAGSFHPAFSKFKCMEVGGGLIALGILGPIVVYILTTIVSVMIKLLIGITIACFCLALGVAIWIAYNKLKKQKEKHDREYTEIKRQRDKVIVVNQHTKNLDWQEEGSKVAKKLLSDEPLLKEIIRQVKKDLD